MSILAEINRIDGNISASLEAVAAKGVTVPDGANSNDLPSLIAAIPEGAELPELTTPGSADDLVAGKQLIDGDGNIVEGAMPVKSVGDFEYDLDKLSVTVPKGYYAKTEAVIVDHFYDKGYDDGTDNGIEYVKTTEARDESHITAPTDDKENDFLPVTVQSGYYNETVVKNFDLTNLFDARYDKGYEDGLAAGGGSSDPTTVWRINDVPDVSDLPNLTTQAYVISFTSNDTSYTGIFAMYIANMSSKISLRYVIEGSSYVTVWTKSTGWANEAYKTITIHEEITDEGLLDWLNRNATFVSSGSSGGTGTDPLLEEMLIVTDENYDDEGKQFYSVYKWLGMYHSNFSSHPWMLELENEHPTLWLHVYVWVDGKVNAGYDEETGQPFYDYVSHNYVLTLEPDYGVNSIEEDEMEVTSFRIEGVRWSTDGV
jgi:hypothetical protein